MDGTIASTSLADRDFWLQRRELVNEGVTAATEVLSGLPGGEVAGSANAHRDLRPAVSTRLDEVTGGEPLLRWTAVAAATSLVLRRFGAGGSVVLLTGCPLRAGLPVLLTPSPALTFREWLGAVREAVRQALAHGDVADAVLQECLDGVAPLSVGGRPNEADTFIEVASGQVVVGSQILSATAVELLATGVTTVLEQGLTDPHRPLADLGVLDEHTRHQVLVAFNDAGELDAATPYRELLLTQAARHPEAVAVHDGKDSLTYQQLCACAVAVATRLRAVGVGRETSVALVARRSAWFLVLAVGILFAGGAYMPVDPVVPDKRRNRLLRGVRFVVAEEEVERPRDVDAVWLSAAELRHIAEVEALPFGLDRVEELLGDPAAPADLAYVIFTSGSTGTPKGACVEHRSFLNLLATRVHDYGLRHGVEVPQTAPLTFDLSIWQMFAGLTAGATICVVPDDVVLDPAALATRAAEHQFECLALVPTFIAVLLDHFAEHPDSARAVRQRLRRMISTGELLSSELARRWHAVMPGVALLNAYGPAEVADDSTGGTVGPDEGPYTSIGVTLPNVRVYVLDDDLQLVPPGVVGQIFIGGDSVGRGYAGEPAMTAAAFVPDPFAEKPGRRMYRTGDRGRWRRDGAVVLLGRADNQVKIRGRRVELGEIEQVLESQADVARAIVELLRDGGLERLVAFVTARPGTDLSAPGLRDFAADRLPRYMVPNEVLMLDALPCNRNGKVDRQALRRVASERTVDADGLVPPRNELESMLCELWASHLKIERIGVTDDFFVLGGDSIMGIRIAQEAGRRGLSLRPWQILEHRTVEALAASAGWLTTGSGEQVKDGTASSSRGSGGQSAPAPLTPAQFAFLSRGVPNPNYWNHGVLYAITRHLDLEEIKCAARLLAERHPALRARITPVDESFVQTISADAPPVTQFDLSGVDPADLDASVHELATGLHAALDLRNGPVCRLGVFRTPHGVHDRLVVVIHHAVVDLYSWDVISEELSALLRDGDDRSLEQAGTSYFDWARRLAEYVRRHPERLDTRYWLQYDWGGCVQVAPQEFRGVEGRTEEITCQFDPEWTQRFMASGRTGGLSVYERLLAALGVAVQDWLDVPGGALQVQLGGHGREDWFDDVDLSRTVGYFNTAYPFLLPLPQRPGDTEYPAAVAELVRQVPGRGMNFEALLHLHPDPEFRSRLADIPAPEVLFNYWGRPGYLMAGNESTGPLGEARTNLSGMDRPADMPRLVQIECYISIVGENLRTLWRFSGEVFSVNRMQALVNAYYQALNNSCDTEETSP